MVDVTIRTLSAISEVSKEAWNALLPSSAIPVLRWEWIHALESSGSATPERGWCPAHLAAFRGGTLVAAVPAWRKFHSMGEYIYDFGWASAAERAGLAYYPKLVVGVPLSPLTGERFLVAQSEGEAKEALRRRLLEAAVAHARESGCSSVHVLFCTGEEVTALSGDAFFERRTLQYHFQNRGYETYDDFLARFDSKRRHQLRRERAAASAQGIAIETIRSEALEAAHAELAWSFYEATASRHSWGPVQLTRDFFLRVFAQMPEKLEMVLARREGRVVAGAFNLKSRSRLYGRYWGAFEDHPFLHFHVCLYHSIDDCIRLGRQVFEPGAGGEHKVARGFEPTRIHSLHRIFDERLERAVRQACATECLHVEAAVDEAQALVGFKPSPP
jgi:predicted N-acyltransferase